jgi:type IV pilus assembly protein PilW
MVIAMALALGLVLAAATLHARVLFLATESARTADAQDTLRIALAVLEYELQHAGYWGLAPDAALIAGRSGSTEPLAVPVSGDCGPGWTTDLDRPLQAWSAGWPLFCAPYGGAPPQGAVLVLRRVDTQAAVPDAGVLQVYGNPWQGRLGASGEAVQPGEEVRDLVARAYYLSPRSTSDPGRPSLRRKTLQRGPRVVDEEVLPGIAGFELALGVDTDLPGEPGRGQPNLFVAPGEADGQVVAVRVRLRADDPAGMSLSRTIVLRNGPAP